jgi:hypothetical protein
MAISNELSSEIAAAILSEKKTPQELHQLKEIILRVHSTLQKMSRDARAEEVTISNGQAQLASHAIDVTFTVAWHIIFRIFRIFYDVVHLVKHCPANVKSSSRLFVADHLPKISKVA